MSKPVTGQTTFGASTSGTTTQLDNNFLLAYNALNDLNTYANFLTDIGAANAYVVTLAANLTGALTNGLVIQMKAANANTGASTLNYNATGAIAITDISGSALSAGAIPANAIVQLQYSSGAGAWLLQTPLVSASATGVQIPVRQTVLTGPLNTTTGLPTLLPASCTSLTVNATNASANAPVVVAAANGFTMSGANDRVGSSTGNLTWSNLTANSINYLGVNVEANQTLTPIFTTVAPVYQWQGATANGNGNYTFNIEQMQMLAGNGSATAQAFTVFVGEANCNGNAAVSIVSYAYQGRFRSPEQALQACSTNAQFNANIGVREVSAEFWIINTTTELGYGVGERTQPMTDHQPSTIQTASPVSVKDRNTVIIAAGTQGFAITSKASSTVVAANASAWNCTVLVRRQF